MMRRSDCTFKTYIAVVENMSSYNSITPHLAVISTRYPWPSVHKRFLFELLSFSFGIVPRVLNEYLTESKRNSAHRIVIVVVVMRLCQIASRKMS
jgi:hypothetical protein